MFGTASTRTPTFLALAFLAVGGVIAYTRLAANRVSADAEREAWALLAEAEELCGRVSLEVGPSSAVRVATGNEALEIARERTGEVEDSRTLTSLDGFLQRVQRRCAEGSTSTTSGRGQHLALRSLDGSGRFERQGLITPYLERLMAAASRSRSQYRPQVEQSDRVSTETPSLGDPLRDRVTSEPVVRTSVPDRSPQRHIQEIERPGIVVSGGSREHRERRARFSRVFSRETRELRAARRALQLEIDRMSLTESRDACRVFGSVLENLDSEFETKAPSRGLALRIARMLAWYQRGVSECVGGRPVAAFVSLSEGDREWGTVASAAARMQIPGPPRSQADGYPSPGRMKISRP